ncbi:ribosomal protein S12 [Burkholderia pseudomallei]|nr:ribosomal protein S12 [Burkholderia pseudomallei]ARL98044.1 ribosomal protein S12 [Burkholderia pseudomallei]
MSGGGARARASAKSRSDINSQLTNSVVACLIPRFTALTS